MSMIDLTPVAQALIALVAALMSAVVVPLLRSRVNAEELSEFLRWVEIGVAAAEQLYAVTDGAKKKNYVLNFLKDKGYTSDMDDIENAIEAAVLRLHKELYYG